jgi:hypothetical protein
MIDEPVPTIPEMVPAIRPTVQTKMKFKARLSKRGTLQERSSRVGATDPMGDDDASHKNSHRRMGAGP